MKCHKAERLILRSLDGRSELRDTELLRRHLSSCLGCRQREKEYRLILEALKKDKEAAPLPAFEERLLRRLSREERGFPGLLWQRWAAKALAFSLILFVFSSAVFLIFRPSEPEDLSQVEVLLLRDENPFLQTKDILEASKTEERNMRLLFTALDERDLSRRYQP